MNSKCDGPLDIQSDEFKKRFPHLAAEFEQKEMAIRIDSASSSKNEKSTRLQGYTPGVIDYLRRCDDADQGKEIITYLQQRNEITAEYAEQLLIQLDQKGIRSFGAKKEDGHYLKMVS